MTFLKQYYRCSTLSIQMNPFSNDGTDAMSSEPSIMSNNIRLRYSTRDFLTKPVSDEDLEGVLHAGIRAPSSKNRQPWNIHVLKGDGVRKLTDGMASRIQEKMNWDIDDDQAKDFKMALRTMEIIRDVPVLLIIGYVDRIPYHNAAPTETGVTDRKLMDLVSIGACIENMILEATERGLGSLWVGDYLYAYDIASEAIDSDEEIVSMVALGYAAEERRPQSGRFSDRIHML